LKKKIIKAVEVIAYILIVLSIVVWVFTNYLLKYYRLSFTTFICLLTSKIVGTSLSVYKQGLLYCLPRIAAVTFLIFGFKYSIKKLIKNKTINLYIKDKKNKEHKIVINMILSVLVILIGFASLPVSIYRLCEKIDISNYLVRYTSTSTIYEDYYVDPENVEIIEPSNKKNLIYIYLESMENIYKFDDGSQCDCISNLTKLALDNISFGKDNSSPGGLEVLKGNSWTTSGLLATTAGIHWGFPIENNAMTEYDIFASGLTSLGDILEDHGYNQEFLIGSYADFSGMSKYFTQHGNYKIYDYKCALNDGYTDDYVWWGLDDACLYGIAKDEITKLANQGKPFDLLMMTIDTHAPTGYICDKCEDNYSDETANVLACADKQVYEFVNWIFEQPFADDTVVIITGDHLRMDMCMTKNIEDRRIYNCIINSNTVLSLDDSNRNASSMDMFPTVLAALGFEIEGDRLGLGTNLFSNKKTLIEELGKEYLNGELAKASKYFDENIY